MELAQIALEQPEYWTKYAFMFPVSACVATTAMLTGIGGAALFSPIFLLGFPLLGPEYPLDSPAEAFNVALLTECFGFTSGLIGYTNRGLVDWRVSWPFIAVGVPAGVAGGLSVTSAEPDALRLGYGAMMAMLGTYLAAPRDEGSACETEDVDATTEECLTLTDDDGETYAYRAPAMDAAAIVATADGRSAHRVTLGGNRRECDAAADAPRRRENTAGGRGGDERLGRHRGGVSGGGGASIGCVRGETPAAFAFPLNLVCYTVPGVMCGGQIGPRLQGTIAQRDAERALGAVFACVGAAFLKAGLGQ